MKNSLKIGIIMIVVLVGIICFEMAFVFLKGKDNDSNNNVPNNSSNNNQNNTNHEEENLDGKNFLDVLMSKKCSKTALEITGEEAKNCLVEENGLRYEGTDPNNYVTFNNETWRIIGILSVDKDNGEKDNLIKLIRKDYFGEIPWDESMENDYFGSNSWDRPATINTLLNSDYLNSMGDYSSNGLSNVLDKIASVKLKVGESENEIVNDEVYQNEAKALTTKAYLVGLINVSDYGYGALNKTCDRSIKLVDYASAKNAGCSDNNWLFTKAEWTLDPYVSTLYAPLFIGTNGYVSHNFAIADYNVRPTIYLKSDVKLKASLTSKDVGSSTNPYVIE